MRIARGIQNKVLEAMAMARPVLVSPQALEGIDAVPGRELLLADDAGGHARAALDCLNAPDAAIGAAARAKVEQLYGWESNLAPVSALLEQRPAQPWPRSA